MEDAREFARLARGSDRLPTGVQNAFKAVEFALKAYAHEEMNRRVRGHGEAKRVAYEIGKDVGDDFAEFMDIYHGSYDRDDGERLERALELMEGLIDEIEGRLTG